MTTIYKHATGTSYIEAVKRLDGYTDINLTCGIGTIHEVMMRHPLRTIECDKLGSALCRDVIENYRKHNDHLKQRDEDLQSTIRNSAFKHDRRTHALNARIEYLEAVNDGLRSDVSNLRIANALYRKRWSEHEPESESSESRGMRSQNFEHEQDAKMLTDIMGILKNCHMGVAGGQVCHVARNSIRAAVENYIEMED